LERLLAASVNAVGKNDECLPAFLRLHQFVGGEIDGVVEHRARTSVASTSVMPAAAATAGISATTATRPASTALPAASRSALASAPSQRRLVRGFELVERRLQFFSRRGQVL